MKGFLGHSSRQTGKGVQTICTIPQDGSHLHVLCGLIVGGGLAYTWQRTWLKIAGTCGLLGAAITLHATYNLLIAYGGAAQYVAYALPVLLVAAGKLSAFRLSQRE